MTEPARAQIHALQRGDAAAWTAVVRWLQPQLDGFFISGGASDHEALTQETLLKMSRNIATFTDGGAPELRAWAFAIARTTRIDDARRSAARPVAIPDSARADDDARTTVMQVDPAPAADDQLADLDAFASLLEELTPAQAELLRLRILGDLTMAEAAAILDLSVGAAKQLERRALRHLRERLSSSAAPTAPAAAPARDERGPYGSNPRSGTPP